MHEIQVKGHLDRADRAALAPLLAEATEADAHPALGESAWLDFVEGLRDGPGGLIAWDRDHKHPIGYAQVSLGRHPSRPDRGASWDLEVVVGPHHRSPDSTVAADLVRRAIDLVGAEGGGQLHLWVSKPGAAHDRLAAAAGLSPGRTLYQMRKALPETAAPTISTRPFRVGRDEAAWLELNNRAFAGHPEQGGWTEQDLKARKAQAWFDPEGFLLYELEGRLAGFCWTKVHPPVRAASPHQEPPPDPVRAPGTGATGEIYVIAVSPELSGRGIGRQLTLAGLQHLSAKGAAQAMLYVGATNVRALHLYVELGFTVDHIDRSYTGEIAPTRGPR